MSDLTFSGRASAAGVVLPFVCPPGPNRPLPARPAAIIPLRSRATARRRARLIAAAWWTLFASIVAAYVAVIAHR